MADGDKLQQIIWNLLTNAVKFTLSNGRIDVNCSQTDTEAKITIKDTGVGIEKEYLTEIFDRFRQVDGSITRSQGGLGLGLSIVRNLVELHGGTVSACSDGPGLGATFTVNLPMRYYVPDASIKAPIPNETATNQPISLSGVRLVLVEDKADTRELMTTILQAQGVIVSEFDSAKDALRAIESQPFDVLISDIAMSDEDGYWLVGKLRQLPANKGGRIPAIALTAFAGMDDRIKILAAGYQIHITKPIEPDELIAVVASFVARSESSL